MKLNIAFPLMLLISSCAKTQDKTYTGSTPAAPVVKAFLGIPMADSVDFIRWNLSFQNDRYTMQCNYGIGKPNTHGFIAGGKKISISDKLKKEKNYYQLQNNSKILKLIEINSDLLHLLNDDNSLLVGNGGWSYTLNNIKPSITDKINIAPMQTILKDSMAFEGRTPCPGLDLRPECLKLKWYIVLYADPKTNQPMTYYINGTAYRRDGGRKGTCKIMPGENGRIIYQLNDDKRNGLIYLLKADENILLFIDANGKLLTGDEDFSYTLNRCR